MSVKVECVVKDKCEIGEGPVWEEKEGTLLYVDITGQRVCRWNPSTNKIQSIRTGEPMDGRNIAVIITVTHRDLVRYCCNIAWLFSVYLQLVILASAPADRNR